MKEIQFLQQNADKWKRFETLIKARRKTSPDRVAELFIELTDDLSYARTFYPESPVTAYLNGLTAKFHQAIYRNKKEERRRLRTFWTGEQPVLFRRHWKEALISLVIFVLSVLVGVVSSANDDGFVRLILGDSYVSMTMDNIEKGDPMAVYKSMNNVNMFLGVTVNNIRVALMAFACGVILSFGAGYIIFYNGIMIGAFHYFFYQKGLLLVSLRSIWIHGALEMTAVVIAGGAGFVIGNDILFPGTFTRAESFKRGAKDGLKMVIGVIPVFAMAGLLEGFVTRRTDMAPALSGLIIGASLAFVIWYYILYPIYHHNKERFHGPERKI
jgi:uncharacterized membrane protein SpoIIM required for sporulation